MNTEQIKSPDGTRSVELEYIGSVHFGPELYRATFHGFQLPFHIGTIYGDVRWSPDGTHLVMVVFHSTRSGQTPDSELVIVTFEEGAARVDSRIRAAKVIEVLDVCDSAAIVLVGNQRNTLAF